MPSLRGVPLSALVAIPLLAACAVNPVTGQREIVFTSPEAEAAQGRQAAAQVEREIGLVRDPELEAYIDRIGQRLARRSPRQDVAYRFAIADMPEPNAFALPGGYIYVSRGLLALANSEDELAAVIGHEIGHVAARHSAQRETRAAGVGLLSVLGAVAAGVAGGAEAARMASQLGQIAGAGLIASYSRDQERQADVVGQQIAAQAGWDPAALAAFLTRLERQGALQQGRPQRPSFLDSHPLPGERAGIARARAGALPRGSEAPIARDRAQYLDRVEGILIGPNPDEGVFSEGGRFLHPGLGFALDFPERWQTQNQKAAVGAVSPRRDAMIVLELQGPAGDPRAAAQRWAQANRVRVLDGESGRVGGYPSFRALAEAQTQQGPLALDVTWIGHPRGTFRLTSITSPAGWRAWAPTFARVAGSFRPLSAAEREAIRPLRLRVARARAGETLAALGRRTANRWSVAETAIASDLPATAPLDAARLVKVAVPAPR